MRPNTVHHHLEDVAYPPPTMLPAPHTLQLLVDHLMNYFSLRLPTITGAVVRMILSRLLTPAGTRLILITLWPCHLIKISQEMLATAPVHVVQVSDCNKKQYYSTIVWCIVVPCARNHNFVYKKMLIYFHKIYSTCVYQNFYGSKVIQNPKQKKITVG